jgi:hypothetical protein
MLVEMKTKKNTAIAATAIGPRSRPRITSRHGPTATHGAALAMVASREIERRSEGMETAARADRNARVPPISRPRVAAHTVAFVALTYRSCESPKTGSNASAGVTTMPSAHPCLPPMIHSAMTIAAPAMGPSTVIVFDGPRLVARTAVVVAVTWRLPRPGPAAHGASRR